MTREDIESKILDIVKRSSDDGVIQSQLWSLLGIDSREGTKAVLKLVRAGLIKREPVVEKGRKTYKLIFVSKQHNDVNLVIRLNPVMSIPCFLCKDLERCGLGGFFNPLSCPKLTKYLLS